ncbi:MAG TPA: riboflavin synthase [Cyclobacteriaceae bacterium]
MFTGIVEAMGTVRAVERSGGNVQLAVESAIGRELRVDQSVSHNGVCLTVVRTEGDTHWVTMVKETLSRSTLGALRVGDQVNLERSMKADGRFDGHIVQGHVDQVGRITSIRDEAGSWLFGFEYDPAPGNITVEKGSICIDGISLTCYQSRDGAFVVSVIPYTFEQTTLGTKREGDSVNLEFDILGKYVRRLMQLNT